VFNRFAIGKESCGVFVRFSCAFKYHASCDYFDALLCGVEIHEYERSFLHAKVAVVDGHYGATVPRSEPAEHVAAREANVVVEVHAFAADLHSRLASRQPAWRPQSLLGRTAVASKTGLPTH
jgi:phosphatidylserine/phosphatidylglycerophosphate/cardiolipin synthase-like enzyme